jgi:hypothetical protein
MVWVVVVDARSHAGMRQTTPRLQRKRQPPKIEQSSILELNTNKRQYEVYCCSIIHLNRLNLTKRADA